MDDDDDAGSLFGSPPPSPGRGRSPELAWPTGRSSSPAQNVGTIALPGSHACSELPINPLALSSRLAPHGITTSRPPAETRTVSSSPAPPVSRPSSTQPAKRLTKKPLKQAKQKARTPRPEPPPIPLPEANEPVPPNFLRSQSALLGTAGLVARVKPALLGFPRGSSSSNPIIVDDTIQSSPSPRIRPRPKPQMRKVYPEVSESLLSVPSHQEVVNVLVAQKDIFPVLEGILKLSGEDTHLFDDTDYRSGFQRRREPVDVTNSPPKTSSHQQSPKKRRKLNHVPAGAADWDVPFPFAEGYGPDSYKRNWKRERAKQLAAELMSLIKDAVKIAATKAYWKQQRALAEQNPSMVPAFSYPSVGSSSPSTPLPTLSTSGDALSPPVPIPSPSPGLEESDEVLDQLVSSLLSAVPGQDAWSAPSLPSGTDQEADTFASLFSDLDSNNVEQSTLDSWMSILQAFPAPQEHFPASTDLLPSTSQILNPNHSISNATDSCTVSLPSHSTSIQLDHSSAPNQTHEQFLEAFANATNDDSLSISASQQNHDSSMSFNPLLSVPAMSAVSLEDMQAFMNSSASCGLSYQHPLLSTMMDVDSVHPSASQSNIHQHPTSNENGDISTAGMQVDPHLLSLSTSVPSTMPDLSSTDSLAGTSFSPIPSSASTLEVGPFTPASTFGELGPGPQAVMTDSSYRGLAPHPYSLDHLGIRHDQNGDSQVLDNVLPLTNTKGKGKAVARPPAVAMYQEPQAPAPRNLAESSKVLEKEQLLERAKARRRELVVQLEDARIRQWEALMEGHALNYLLQHS